MDLVPADERLDPTPRYLDGLDGLNALMPWEEFRPALEAAVSRDRRQNPEYGQCDPLQLFRAAVLKNLYDLTDAQAAFLIQDRLSFRRFVGLHPEESPAIDGKGLWTFLELLRWEALLAPLFGRFNSILGEAGVKVVKGKIVEMNVFRNK